MLRGSGLPFWYWTGPCVPLVLDYMREPRKCNVLDCQIPFHVPHSHGAVCNSNIGVLQYRRIIIGGSIVVIDLEGHIKSDFGLV